MPDIECILDILSEDNETDNLLFTDDRENETKGRLRPDALTELTIRRLSYWVARGGFVRDDLRLLGQHLFNVLFDGDILTVFARIYKVFNERIRKSEPGTRLRLVLRFHPNTSKLASYPWEFLFMPVGDEGFFLAGQDTELILTRLVPGEDTIEKLHPGERLKILVAFCHPSDLGIVQADNVITDIMVNVKTHSVDIVSLDNPTVTEIKKGIEIHQPHIFHFIGHGEDGGLYVQAEPDEIQERRLIDGDKRESKKMEPSAVSSWFTHKPQIVFLQACEGAQSCGSKNFNNAALELVQNRIPPIPAVIAMQFPITNGDALRFSRTFYRHLSEGISIDAAVAKGRNELGTNQVNKKEGIARNDRCFGTPVVYLRTRHAVIMDPPPIRCPNCKVAVQLDFKFCPDCGERFGKCDSCGNLMCLRFGCTRHETSRSSATGREATAADSPSDLQARAPSAERNQSGPPATGAAVSATVPEERKGLVDLRSRRSS